MFHTQHDQRYRLRGIPTLKKLHWLPIKQSITNSVFSHTKHLQINNLLYNSLSFPSHSVSTRSSDSLVFSIPYVRSSLGKRAFSVIGPRLWNSLPPDTRNSSSLPIFRSRLKTHLFKIWRGVFWAWNGYVRNQKSWCWNSRSVTKRICRNLNCSSSASMSTSKLVCRVVSKTFRCRYTRWRSQYLVSYLIWRLSRMQPFSRTWIHRRDQHWLWKPSRIHTKSTSNGILHPL